MEDTLVLAADSFRRKPIDTQISQTKGNAGDAEFAAPHAEHGLLGPGDDKGLVLLELRCARDIAVSRKSEEGSATCLYS